MRNPFARHDNGQMSISFNPGLLFSGFTLGASCLILFSISIGLISTTADWFIQVCGGAVLGAILGLGSFLLQINRMMKSLSRSNEDFQESLDQVEELIGITSVTCSAIDDQLFPSVDYLFKERIELPDFSNAVRNAKTLDMNGMSLRNNTTEHRDLFEELLEKNGKCRFSLVDPQGQAPDVIAKRFDGNDTSTDYRQEIIRSIEKLMRLKKKYPDNVSIVVTDHIPAVSITILDFDSDAALCFVEMYTYPTNNSARQQMRRLSRPHFSCDKESPVWCRYFLDQFEEIYKSGTEVDEITLSKWKQKYSLRG